MTAYGGTPTAFAYAEAGAYMLGETTSGVSNSGYSAAVSDIKDSGKYKNLKLCQLPVLILRNVRAMVFIF